MKIGDVVAMKCGGPNMVIVEHGNSSDWKCLYYFDGTGEVKFGFFPEIALSPVRPATAKPAKRRAR